MPTQFKKQNLLTEIKQDLSGFLKSKLSLSEKEIFLALEQPRRPEHGHLAIPLFSLFQNRVPRPEEQTRNIANQLNKSRPSFLKSCEALSCFVNFWFQESYLQKKLESLISKSNLGSFKRDKHFQEHWVIDFASPNVAKHMNIAHLRATVLGQALVNLARCFGIKVTALNHLGDWGSQFGKLLWAFKKWSKEYDFENQALNSLAELYVRFHKKASSDERNLQEARELFNQLEQGNEELKKLWKQFVHLSLKDYEQYWELLNVKHDLVQGESFYIDLLEDLKKRLKAKNLLKKSEGAEVVFLEENKPPCLIAKRDGASTYAARDLCSLIFRFEKLKVNKNIYITASEQNLHFKQIFQVADLLNPQWEKQNLHLSFGIYKFKGEGKMSTRQGQTIYLKDILEQTFQRVEKIIEERNPDLQNKREISQQVGVGALVFNDLMNDRVKDVDFEWSRILDFEGHSGPFVQYSLVRAGSLLNKYKPPLPFQFAGPLETSEEKKLVWQLLCFEDALFRSFEHFKPHILARYLLDLAREFNRFYASQKILGQKREIDLLLLTKISHRVLKKGLEILNIPRPQAM